VIFKLCDDLLPCLSFTHLSLARSIVNITNSQNPLILYDSDFNFIYTDGRSGEGFYFIDVFGLGPNHEKEMNIQMGLALDVSKEAAQAGGTMGIGYSSDNGTNTTYPSLIEELFQNKLINTRLYSLWLNDIQSGVGSILFGGIDTEKYYDKLYSSPVLEDSLGKITSFNISLTSLSIQPEKGNSIPFTDSSFSTGVILESLDTNSYLPYDLVTKLYQAFEVKNASDGIPYIDCKYSNSSTMTFGFLSGSSIDVAYSDLIFPINWTAPSEVSFPNICQFGIYAGFSDP
jgi:hypothetical protein